MDRVSYEDDPMLWSGLHSAALGNLITAIKQLKRISFRDEDITGTLQVLLEKENEQCQIVQEEVE